MKKLVIIFVLISSVAAAQDVRLPQIGDHVFFTTPSIRNPQPVTNLNTILGFALSDNDTKFPATLPNGTPVGLQGNLIAAILGVNGSVAFEDWIGFRYSMMFSTRVGTDVSSLLSQGFTQLINSELGWQLRVYQTERLSLSAYFGVNRIEGQYSDVLGWASDLVNGEETPSITTDFTILTGEFGVLAGYSFGKLVGVTGDFALESGTELVSNQDQLYWSSSLAVDFNFYRSYRIPIGMTLAYTSTTLPEELFQERDRLGSFKINLGYAGSDEFVLGLVLTTSNTPLPRIEDKVRVKGVQLVSQFFF